MTSVRPRLSFVIPVRNDARRLARCLDSIKANRAFADNVEIIVIDNGSKDSSALVGKSAGARVLSEPSLRLGGLRNAGARVAQGDLIAFVDADHEVDRSWVATALLVMADDSVGAAGADCVPPQPANWVQELYDRMRRHSSGQHEVEWLGSGNVVVRRHAFESVGGFDESLETCEDVDLCRRLRGGGYRLVADSRLRNIHYGDPSTLGQVFRGELWRGRDNLRVSFRPPLHWRSISSALVPLLVLAGIAAGLGGVMVSSIDGGLLLAGALVFLGLSVVLRALRMAKSVHPVDRFAGALAVAAAYEAGRALALASRAGHNLRRPTST